MTSPADTPPSAPPEAGVASRRAVAGWLLFDWATQPFYTLVTAFIFGPYFVAEIASDPVAGQSEWGLGAGIASLVIAVLAPILGAVADAGGRRKAWIAAFSAMLVGGALLLWFATPGTAPFAVLLVAAIATIGVEFATVFNNAMMPDLVPADRLGRLSGTGWALGYVGGLVATLIALGFLVADPATGETLFGLPPVFGLDAVEHGGDRASGPFSALWYVVFALPLFLFTPDVPKRLTAGAAIRSGLRQLADTLRSLRDHAPVARYLVAHMIYADGLAALFAFGGIYGVGLFGWSSFELGVFGIILTITGGAGAFLGGRLDDRFGPKRVILWSLAVLTVGSAGVLSIDGAHVLLFVPVEPAAAGDAAFGSTGERLYLLLGAVVGAAAGPLQSASRSMMVRLSPPERITQLFGLHALSGKVTSFFATLGVSALTALAGSQQIGLSLVLVFFVAGGIILLGVRDRAG
ncbi:MAG: MFS transporter [Bauldia sp.]|nr:MFS transporter [Bauldia sp.]